MDRVIEMKNAHLVITDSEVTLVDLDKVPGTEAMFRITGDVITIGDSGGDMDLVIRGAQGSLTYDAGAGFFRAATTPIIGSGIAYPLATLTNLTSNAGYTMTAAQMLSGLIIDLTGTGGIAATLPTVAAVVALIPGWVAGTSFLLWYKNTGNQTMTLTVDASAQWTMTGTMTALTTTTRVYMCIIATAATGTVYSLGTFAE